MSRLAVFGYGSLVSRASAAQTLGRAVASVHPARLHGWSRAWTLCRDNLACEKTFARADGSLPHFCLGLNLERSERRPTSPNGALIEVTEAELGRLDRREMRYSRVEVSAQVESESRPDPSTTGFDRVYAYTARPEHHCAGVPADAILIASYLRTVERAFAELGGGELELFRATTVAPSIEITEAGLVDGERIPPGNPREW